MAEVSARAADRLPPQSVEAESSVLGSMLIQGEALARGLSQLTPEDFYHEGHRVVFTAMRQLFEEDQPVDLVTLSEALKRKNQLEAVGGVTYLSEISSAVPTAANLDYYAKIVRDKALLRSIIGVGTSVVSMGYEAAAAADQILDDAERLILGIAESRVTGRSRPIKDVLMSAVSQIDAMYGSKSGITGVPTGFATLDDMTAGLQKSDFIVVAARPSMGKTQLALNIARSAAKQGTPVAIFSLEMSEEQLAIRLVCAEGEIDSQRLRRGQLEEEDWKRFSWAVSELSKLPIYIDDTPMLSALDLRTRSRRLKHEHNIGLVIVDYLQLMEVRGHMENRQQEISNISRGIKALARELQLPVITLSQLSRAVESRQDRHPMLSDLRESGAIEQDADIVAFIYREQYYQEAPPGTPDFAEVSIAKQRNGPTGTIRLLFRKDVGRFYDLDEHHSEA